MTTQARPAALQEAATSLRHQGYNDLADLISAIARASSAYRHQPVASIDEALRWTPVVSAALRFTEGLHE